MNKRVILNQLTVDLVDKLKKYADVKKTTEIVNYGVSLLAWAVNQSLKGKTIASFDPISGELEAFSMPILDQISKKAESMAASKQPIV